MLLKEAHLQGIKSGIVNLAFRKWEKNQYFPIFLFH